VAFPHPELVQAKRAISADAASFPPNVYGLRATRTNLGMGGDFNALLISPDSRTGE
jgi:hypothetical protein